MNLSLNFNETEVKVLLLMSKIASDTTWTEPSTKQAMKEMAVRLQKVVESRMPFLKTFVEDKGGLGDF
jgi:hypothetical protein